MNVRLDCAQEWEGFVLPRGVWDKEGEQRIV